MQDRIFKIGDYVRSFKSEIMKNHNEYLYEIIAFAHHTETNEKLVIYRALTGSCNTYARPHDMFMSEVDREKYPNVKQKYRFEKVEVK